MPRSRWTRKIVWVAVALLLVGLLAPLVISLNFWRGRISSALSTGLGRRVRAGAIHPKLFGGLGFELENVVVEEDPRFGAEPFVRMETLRATLQLRSFWSDQMQFSSLVFVRPSLNAVRNSEGHWNVESLWRAAAPEAVAGDSAAPKAVRSEKLFHALPQIQIQAGRINFKSGNSKKTYLIDGLDMAITPPSTATEPWRLSFEGRPTRTDFNPVSRFRGQAAFGPFAPAIQRETGTLAHLDLTADNALISDLLKLFTDYDYGVHGSFNLNLHLAGTTSLLRVSGTAEVRELHRWDRLPPLGGSVLHADLAGILDLEREALELQSVSIPLSKGSVVVQGEVDRLFHRPRPDLEAQLHAVPLGNIVEIVKQFTTHLDPGITAQGSLNGRVEIVGGLDTLSGGISVTAARFEQKGTPLSAKLSDFEIVFSRGNVQAGPASITLGEGGKLWSTVEWSPANRQLAARLEADAIRLNAFLPWARALGSRWGRADFSRGSLALRVNVLASAGQAALSGWAQISDALLNSNAVNQPIAVRAARLQFQPGKVIVKPLSAELGPLELRGSFVARLSPPQPGGSASAGYFPKIEFDCRAGEIDLASLDRLMNPRYRARSFFRFGNGAPGSAFFSNLEARGVLQAASFSYRGSAIKDLKAAIEYHDRALEIKSFSGEFAGGAQNGKASIQLGPGARGFSIQGRFSNLDLNQLTRQSASWGGFFSGKLSGNLRLASSGRELQEILDHLGGSGEASGVNLELGGMDLTQAGGKSEPVTRINSLSSAFQIARKQVFVTELKVVPAAPVAAMRPARGEPRAPLIVTGSVGFDRTLDLLVTEKAGRPGRHWGGTLAEPVVGDTAALLRSGSN